MPLRRLIAARLISVFLFRFFTLFCVRFWGKGSIKTRKNPVSMPIYKISPKAAKSPDHNSDSKGQRFESPRPHHTKTPCTFKKVQGVFSFETIPDRTGFILRPDQGWSYQHKQHQRIPKKQAASGKTCAGTVCFGRSRRSRPSYAGTERDRFSKTASMPLAKMHRCAPSMEL